MIHTWSRGSPGDNMPEDILLQLEPLVRRHPWWHARAALLLSLLERGGVAEGAAVLDVGCGWGVTLEALERRGYRAVGLDVSRLALTRLERPGRELIEADLTAPLPQDAASYDAVVALDVLEHIDDERRAVANLWRLTRPGGTAIVTVPALPDLFTEFDDVQGHRRRYLPDTLRQAFAGSAFTIERMLWWGGWLVPLFRLQRRRRKARRNMTPAEIYAQYLAPPRWPLSAVVRLAFLLDTRRALAGRLARGTSLVAIARRAA